MASQTTIFDQTVDVDSQERTRDRGLVWSYNKIARKEKSTGHLIFHILYEYFIFIGKIIFILQDKCQEIINKIYLREKKWMFKVYITVKRMIGMKEQQI